MYVINEIEPRKMVIQWSWDLMEVECVFFLEHIGVYNRYPLVI